MESSGTHLWLVLWKAYESLRAHAERHIRSLGIGFSEFAALEVLLHKGPTPVNGIGEAVHLTSGSITTAIDRLERKGLVTRCDHPSDRRARLVRLTAEGHTLIEDAFREHQAAMTQATAGLSADERRQAIQLLKKLGLHAAEQIK